VWSESRRQQLPLVIFSGAEPGDCPAVYAAAEGTLERRYHAIGVLGLVTLALTVYLFVVVFQPERLMSIVRNTTRAIRMTLVLWC